MTITISEEEIKRFIKENPGHWAEGLDEQTAKEVKRMAESEWWAELGLVKKFYWRKAKSYVINDVLGGVCFCISREYYDALSSHPQKKGKK